MIFRSATVEDREEILSLYRSAVGSAFCTWNEAYPGETEVDSDLKNGTVFLWIEGDSAVGAFSVVGEREYDDFPEWKERKDFCDISRVTVRKDYRGRGLAAKMLSTAEPILKERGIRAVRLLVAKNNLPAVRTYEKLGYAFLEEHFLYGIRFLSCEKRI